MLLISVYIQDRCSAFLFVIYLLCGSTHGVLSDNKFYVTPMPSNPDCPNNSQCYTLNDYALNSETYFESYANITLLFLGGTHNLTAHDFVLKDRDYVHFASSSADATIKIGPQRGILLHNMTKLQLSHVFFTVLSSNEDRYLPKISISMVQFYEQMQIDVFALQLSIENVLNIAIADSNFNESILNVTQQYNSNDFTPGDMTVTNCSMFALNVLKIFSIDIVSNGKPWKVAVTQSNITSSLAAGFSQAIYLSFTGSPSIVSVIECVVDQTLYGVAITNMNCDVNVEIKNTKVNSRNTGISVYTLNGGFVNISFCQSSLIGGISLSLSDESEIVTKLESSKIASETKDGIHLDLCSKNCLATLSIVRSNISSTSKAGVKIVSDQTSGIILNANFSQSQILRSSYGVYFLLSIEGNVEAITNNTFNISFNDTIFYDISDTALYLNIPSFDSMAFALLIQNCLFVRNGGTVLNVLLNEANSTQKNKIGKFITVDNCSFLNNTFGSSVVKIDATSISDMANAPIVVFSRILFLQNELLSSGHTILQLIGSVNAVIENCTFEHNIGTPITVMHSNLIINERNYLVNNNGFQGAGISLFDSQLVLNNNTHLIFENNHATDVGGAIYVVKNPYSLQSSKCFYQIPLMSDKTYSLNITLEFTNNTAGRGGNAIYGAALHDDCTVSSSASSPAKSVDVFKDFFQFNNTLESSLISSDPKRVCLCTTNDDSACANISYILVSSQELYPGEKFNVSATVVGDEFGTLTSTVYASILDSVSGEPTSVDLGVGQSVQAVNFEKCNDLTYSLHSYNATNGTLILKVNLTSTGRYGNYDILNNDLLKYEQSKVIPSTLLTTPVYKNFTLLDCPMGFAINELQYPPSCVCNEFLSKNKISSCTIQNHNAAIYRTGTQWIGFYTKMNSNDIVLTQYCPYGYCKPGDYLFNLSDHDVLCSNGRSGLLCGSCADNFSIVLGNSECQKCSSNNHIALLLVFLLAGLLLVSFIHLLDLTVAIGSINGLLFYTNIVWANIHTTLPPEYKNAYYSVVRVFLAWLNLDFGIETCFFVGMNAYWKTWLQFLFPLYVWIIAGLIILASKYSFRASRFFGNNSIPVLATIFLLSYSKILRFIIKVLRFTYLYYPGGYMVVWTEDANIPYVGLLHGVLFVFALFCLTFLWAPFMLTLLFIQPLRKINNVWALRWIQRWKPLFDSYTGPLKDKHQYWIGALLFARGVILVTSATTSAVLPRMYLLVIAVTTAFVGFYSNVYQKWYLSVLEKSFLLNLMLLACTLLYVDSYDIVTRLAVSYTSGTIALAQFGGIIIGHAVYRVNKLRNRRRLRRNFASNNVDDDDHHYREPLIAN